MCGSVAVCFVPHSIGPGFLNMCCQSKQTCYAWVQFSRAVKPRRVTFQKDSKWKRKTKIIFPDLVQINEGMESVDITGCDWWKINLKEIKQAGERIPTGEIKSIGNVVVILVDWLPSVESQISLLISQDIQLWSNANHGILFLCCRRLS